MNEGECSECGHLVTDFKKFFFHVKMKEGNGKVYSTICSEEDCVCENPGVNKEK